MDNKPIYSIQTTVTEEMLRWVNLSRNRGMTIATALIFFLGGFVCVFSGRPVSLIVGAIAMIGGLLLGAIKLVLLPNSIKNVMKHMTENDELDVTFDFYEDHVIRINRTGTQDCKYANISYMKENDRWLALWYPVNKLIMIDKANCSEEELAFVRGLVPAENMAKAKKKTTKNTIVLVLILIVFIADLIVSFFL